MDFSDLGGVALSSDAIVKPQTNQGIDFSDLGGERIEQPELKQDYPLRRALSKWLIRPAIEGGAMTLGGTAGAIAGSPVGPIGSGLAGVASAAAMYPPAKQAADAVDQLLGIGGRQMPTPSLNEQALNIAKDFGTGVAIETGGRAIQPAIGLVGKVLPGAKTGEAFSGTPARNLQRAYKKGFYKTYLKPGLKTRAQVGEEYGAAKAKLLGDYLSPEEQANMLLNPRGEANSQISDAYIKFLKGEKISAKEAIATRQAIDTVYPPETARNMPRIAKFAEFRDHLNNVLNTEVPEFKAKSDEMASSILRSQLLKPARVNKTNPDQYSKLSGMFTGLLGAGSIPTGTVVPAVSYMLGTSPLAMGLAAATAGSFSRPVMRLLGKPFIRRALTSIPAQEQ